MRRATGFLRIGFTVDTPDQFRHAFANIMTGTAQELVWTHPTSPLDASPDRVDFWRWRLVPPAETTAKTILNHEEQQRAARFLVEEVRVRWIAARQGLRTILSTYLKLPADEIAFVVNDYGKPEIVPQQNENDLRFNLSHSHDRAALAITRNHAVGVDIERIRDDLEIVELAERFFAPAEAAQLKAIPQLDLQRQAFFACWTRKEAYIKAHGKGLSHLLSAFVVSFLPTEQPKIIYDDADPNAGNRWSVLPVQPWPNYAGAVVVQNPKVVLRTFDFALPAVRQT